MPHPNIVADIRVALGLLTRADIAIDQRRTGRAAYRLAINDYTAVHMPQSMIEHRENR